MAWKFIECGPPKELSWPHILASIWQRCHICEDCGQKTHWGGCANGLSKSKQGTFPIRVNGKTYQVRRLIWASMGKTFVKNDRIVTGCTNPRCIASDKLKRIFMRHIVADAVKSGKIHTTRSRIKNSKTKQAQVGKLTDDDVRRVYFDPRTEKEAYEEYAAEFGCTPRYIKGIKSGAFRSLAIMDFGPFAGLGERR